MKRQRIETRRMLLLLPLLIIPLFAGLFSAFGGGKSDAGSAKPLVAGINTKLPDAKFGADTLTDKMSVYDQAGKIPADSSANGIAAVADRLGFPGLDENPQTKAIEEKINMLKKQIASPYAAAETPVVKKPVYVDQGMGKDVEKLEMLMKSMQASSGEDAEMKQLSEILKSIQEIQNPDLAARKYKDAVASSGLEVQFSAIPAMIDGDQKAVQGSVVKLKLLDTIMLNGQVIPKGHAVFGLASFSNQRLNLEIKNIRLGNLIVPVNLTVFDRHDAMAGINAPEAMLTDAVNSGSADAIGGIGISGFDLTTQIAGAGIDAAKSLLTKKLKRVKHPLKSGYPLLLRDNTLKNRSISH